MLFGKFQVIFEHFEDLKSLELVTFCLAGSFNLKIVSDF